MSDDECEKNALAKKKLGNRLTGERCYSSATDIYLTGLRGNELVATLLSNRAQAYIELQQWPQAVCDAAASLTLRPISDKTWARYDLCMGKLKAPLLDGADDVSARKMLSFIVPMLVVDSETSQDVNVGKAQLLKASGNEAFMKKDHLTAVTLYTEALAVGGETIRAILGNWAFCALKTGALGDVVAACTTALRIGVGEKALHRLVTALSRLGEHHLAQDILRSVQAKAYESLRVLEKEIVRAKMCTGWFRNEQSDDLNQLLWFLHETPAVVGNWRGHVETYLAAKKGRGLRATKAIPEGTVVLVEWAPVHSTSDFSNTNDNMILSAKSDGIYDMNTSAKIKWHTIHRLQRDGVLEQVLNRLSGGAQDKSQELVPLTDLLANLEMFPFLLPCHREYMRTTIARSELPKERVDSILDTNIHGHSVTDGNCYSCSSRLYPAVSMMNHSLDPNCSFISTSMPDLAVITTTRDVVAGEELCMIYHNNAATLKHKWGIQ
jgi:SET domain